MPNIIFLVQLFACLISYNFIVWLYWELNDKNVERRQEKLILILVDICQKLLREETIIY